MKQMLDHFHALREDNLTLCGKLFSRAGEPWGGEDSLSLRYAMLQLHAHSPMMSIGGNEPDNTTYPYPSYKCPVRFSDTEARDILEAHDVEGEKMADLAEMKDVIGTDSFGWVLNDERVAKARDVVRQIKEGLLEHWTTEIERRAVLDHFPFDDHDEDA